MKVTYTQFNPNTPQKNLYHQGVDYLQEDFDLDFDDTFYLLKKLKNHRSHIWIEAKTANLDFYIEFDDTLWVEIYGYENSVMWAISEINLEIGKEILKFAFEGKDFKDKIPSSKNHWDAYTTI